MKLYWKPVLLLIILLLVTLPAHAQDLDTPPAVKPFIMPVAGEPDASSWLLIQAYGNTTGAFVNGASSYSAGQFLHFGIDLSMPCGTPLVAVATGEVDAVDNLNRGSAPHNLLLRYPDLGLVVLYGHLLERPNLVRGQTVQQGEFVALSGDPTGDCESRPHLHLEVRSLNYAIAYNPIDYINAPWNSLAGLGSRSTPLFQRDLNNPRRWMSLTDQPDVRFGGNRLNSYQSSLTLPLPNDRRPPPQTEMARPHTPVSDTWTLRQLMAGGCCAGAWWNASDSNRLYVVDGEAGQVASVFEIYADARVSPTVVQAAPPPVYSVDGTHQIIYASDKTTVRRLSDGMEWLFLLSGSTPGLSPDNQLLMWEGVNQQIWVGALDGSGVKLVWQGRNSSARWLDANRLLISDREEGRFSSLYVVDVRDASSYQLGTWYNLRSMQVAPGGERLIFYSSFNPDAANDGMFVLELVQGAAPQKLPWFADYRWRDSESVFYITFNAATDVQQLHYFDVLRGDSMPLTNPDIQPFTIGNGDWSVSPDGNVIVFQEAQDNNLWLLEAVDEVAESR